MMELRLGDDFNPEAQSESDYLDDLYQIFLTELVNSEIIWKNPGRKLSLRRQPEISGRHRSFWHIVSGGNGSEEDREIEMERCKRIHWIRSMVERFAELFPDENSSGIRWWVSPDPRWRGRRYLLATLDYSYVVVVEEREKYALLVTAYFIEQDRRRKKMRDEHEGFWGKMKQGPPA